MNPQNDLAADLPPPNPDEPASLRRDIVDELADHLACAARQEALRAELDTDGETPDEQTITDRVLARFGDPRRIARRLWFDAMKGRLMMQKLTAAFAAIAAVGAIAGCVLLWTALDATRSTLSEAIAENRKDRQASEDANRAVLAQLAKLQTDAKKPPRSLEWNPLRVKLVRESDQTKPATAYSLKLSRSPFKSDNDPPRKRTSDKSGLADFGLVRAAQYSIDISSPTGQYCSPTVVIEPGTENDLTFVVPDAKTPPAMVDMKLHLPEDLDKRGCIVVVKIDGPFKTIGTDKWNHWGFAPGRDLWLRPKRPPEQIYSDVSGGTGTERLNMIGTIFKFRPQPTASTRVERWLAAEYSVQQLLLIVKDPDLSGSREAYLVVDRVSYGTQRNQRGLFIETPLIFRPQAGRNNEWTIVLPPKIIENARARLAALDRRQALKQQSQLSDEQFIKKLPATGTGFDKLTVAERRDYVAQVRYYFSIMDERGNKDGMLQESEWNVSRRIKPAFERAKIDLTKDMTERDFMRFYIRVFPDPSWKQSSPAKKKSKE